MMVQQEEKKKSRLRLKLFFVFMGVFSLLFQLGSYSIVTEDEASQFMDQIKLLIVGIDEVGIWLNNLKVASMMFVPFGFIIGGFIAFQTGWAVAAASVLNPELTEMPAIALLYLTPFGILELICYAIAMSRSVLLVQALVQKRFKKQLLPTLKEYIIVSVVLLAAGIIEWRMILWASEQGVSIF